MGKKRQKNSYLKNIKSKIFMFKLTKVKVHPPDGKGITCHFFHVCAMCLEQQCPYLHSIVKVRVSNFSNNVKYNLRIVGDWQSLSIGSELWSARVFSGIKRLSHINILRVWWWTCKSIMSIIYRLCLPLEGLTKSRTVTKLSSLGWAMSNDLQEGTKWLKQLQKQ